MGRQTSRDSETNKTSVRLNILRDKEVGATGKGARRAGSCNLKPDNWERLNERVTMNDDLMKGAGQPTAS